MDEFSNGKIEETDKVETEVKESEKLVIEDAQEPRPESESEFLTEILIDSLKESFDSEEKEEAKEESCIMEGLELEVQEKEEEEIINSIADSDELNVEIPVDSDGIEVEPEGIGETEIKTLKGIDEIPRTRGIGENGIESKGTDEEVQQEGFNVGLLLNGARETMWTESTPNKPNGGESEVAGLSETEDKILPFPSLDNDPSEGILEKEVVSPLNENAGLTEVVSRGIQEIKVEENSSVKNIEDDDSRKPSPNAVIVGSNDAFPETPGNPNVISISQRTMQPTTWRSCCGLFQVLKGSKR